MEVFTPKMFHRLAVYYHITQGQKGTFDQPEIPTNVDDFHVYFITDDDHEETLGEELEKFLIEKFGDKWEKEIINDLL